MNWCSFFRVRNVDFQSATTVSNRRVLERAVETTAAEGRAPGLIAYRDGEPIGWVSLGPREDYVPAASAYKGTLTMFERAGFEVAARRRANRASPERPIVRRRVRRGPAAKR